MWQNSWVIFLIGVETRGKAESRKKKVEIAKSKIACYKYLSTPSEKAFAFSRPSSEEGQLYCFAVHF